ncbi:MAG: hypothetical protein AB2A00_31035 [Myxococcota bacterium]
MTLKGPRLLARLAPLLVLCALAACTDGDGSLDGGPDAGAPDCVRAGGQLDCSEMCSSYCAKLVRCGVQSGGSSCTEDCRTLTEAGASTESYQCVIDKTCSEISNCGI